MALSRRMGGLLVGVLIVSLVLLVSPMAGVGLAVAAPVSPASTGAPATTPHSLGLARAVAEVHDPVPASSSSGPRANLVDPSGDTLSAAIASLQAGHGPAGLPAVDCASYSKATGLCGAVPSTSHPAGLDSLYGFQNTTIFGLAPPQLEGASLAWDENLGVVVMFGGYSPLTGDYSNQTWFYFDATWLNYTYAGGPSARAWSSMVYDANIDGLVMAGGCGVTLCPLNDTWTEIDGVWTNVTADAGPLAVEGPGLYSAQLAVNGTNGVVLYGGCWDASCDTPNSYTLFYSVYNLICPVTGDPCWWYYPSMATPPARFDTTFVQDGYNGLDYLYGGYSFGGGTGGTNGFNDTWVYNPANYTWVDITFQTLAVYGEYPSGATFGMTLFYDPISEVMILYGGENASEFILTGELWVLDGYGWYLPLPLAEPAWAMSFAPIASPPADYDTPPILWGGVNQSGVEVTNSSWVWEYPLYTTDNVAPTSVETNQSVYLFSNTTGGSCDDFYYGYCSADWYLGNGQVYSGGNVSVSYTVAGTYDLWFVGYDEYGASNWTSTTITVTTYTVDASASPTSAPPGTQITFSATPAGGTLPYNYTWNFSDGSTAYGASVAHSF